MGEKHVAVVLVHCRSVGQVEPVHLRRAGPMTALDRDEPLETLGALLGAHVILVGTSPGDFECLSMMQTLLHVEK